MSCKEAALPTNFGSDVAILGFKHGLILKESRKEARYLSIRQSADEVMRMRLVPATLWQSYYLN